MVLETNSNVSNEVGWNTNAVLKIMEGLFRSLKTVRKKLFPSLVYMLSSFCIFYTTGTGRRNDQVGKVFDDVGTSLVQDSLVVSLMALQKLYRLLYCSWSFDECSRHELHLGVDTLIVFFGTPSLTRMLMKSVTAVAYSFRLVTVLEYGSVHRLKADLKDLISFLSPELHIFMHQIHPLQFVQQYASLKVV